MLQIFIFLLGTSTALVIYPNDDQDKYVSWSEWSPCSASCGQGISYRYRKCNNTNSNLRIPRDVIKVTSEASQTTEIPEDDFGFVFIQDNIIGRRKKAQCNSLFEEEARKCQITNCSNRDSFQSYDDLSNIIN